MVGGSSLDVEARLYRVDFLNTVAGEFDFLCNVRNDSFGCRVPKFRVWCEPEEGPAALFAGGGGIGGRGGLAVGVVGRGGWTGCLGPGWVRQGERNFADIQKGPLIGSPSTV